MEKDINQLHTSVAVIGEKIDGVLEHLKILNGKAVTNMQDIDELKISEARVISSIKSAKWVASITMTLLLTITVYAYNGDKAQLEAKTEAVAAEVKIVAQVTEIAKKDLEFFQNSLLSRLEALVPPEKMKEIEYKEAEVFQTKKEQVEKAPLIKGEVNGVPLNEDETKSEL
ncbi:MAG: hypothetical protein U1C12_01675 [Patescibacteria group bacterium]|nr:hypothetical protein [Patescibacteria group bacterium]